MAQPVPLGDLVACVDREIAMRVKTYQRWVKQKKMTVKGMEQEMARMHAVRAALLRGEAQARLLSQFAERELATRAAIDQAIEHELVDITASYPLPS